MNFKNIVVVVVLLLGSMMPLYPVGTFAVNVIVQNIAKKFGKDISRIYTKTSASTVAGNSGPHRMEITLFWGSITIGDYFIKHLNEEELEILIIREFVHASSWHTTKKMAFIASLCSMNNYIFNTVQKKDNPDLAAGMLFSELLAYIGFVLYQERFADQEAMALSDNPEALESAYKKLPLFYTYFHRYISAMFCNCFG